MYTGVPTQKLVSWSVLQADASGSCARGGCHSASDLLEPPDHTQLVVHHARRQPVVLAELAVGLVGALEHARSAVVDDDDTAVGHVRIDVVERASNGSVEVDVDQGECDGGELRVVDTGRVGRDRLHAPGGAVAAHRV